MTGLDSFLGWAIPAGIIIFLGVKIYQRMSKDNPNWFVHLKEWIGEKTAARPARLDPMSSGQIVYTR